MSNFEQRWEEAFEGIKESNYKKFGEWGGVMSLGFAALRPLFELFYNQGKEDLQNTFNTQRVDLIDSKLDF